MCHLPYRLSGWLIISFEFCELVTDAKFEICSEFGSSSMYFSMDRLRAFMKKLATVDVLRPSCSAIVAWISLLGRLISLKMATRVRLCISVNTRRGFFKDF